jgi:UDP-2,3-diacylglucosamine pyrophosphatase LpxH
VVDLEDFTGPDPERVLAAERKAWKAERKELEAETDRLRALLDLTAKVQDGRGRRIEWKPGRKKAGRSRAVVTAILSDLHLDETVRPEEMHHVNAYNRRIAGQRLSRWVDRACTLPREYMAGVDYDGAALFLAGDLLSGDIHEELRKTNADTIAGSIAYWIDPLSEAVRALADTYGKVTVDVVAGNHGRNPLNRRSPAKGRARDNFDTLIGWLIARDFSTDQRVEVHVEESTDAYRTIYDTRYLVNHGDSAKGGTGIAGALSPLMLFSHRKGKATAATGQPYDLMVVGHFHQYMSLPGQGLIVNGSLKGWDEFARISGFSYEPPQQGLWLTTPERGVTVTMPVHVQDRRQEKW